MTARQRPHLGRALLLVVALAAASVAAPAAVALASEEPPPVALTLFYGEGCPYCAAERAFLVELQSSRPELVVEELEVWNDAANRDALLERAAAAGIEADGVPVTFLGERAWLGFDEAVAAGIVEAVDAAIEGRPAPEEERTTLHVPLFGEVDVGHRSLVVSTLVIGFVDGINPCSLWVLAMLLALTLHSGSRRRVLLVGSVFLVVTSLMYGLYVAGIYTALTYVAYLAWIQRAVAVVVGTLGVLQLRDALAPGRGPHLGITRQARPGVYRRMRATAVADRPAPAVIGATAALAVGVSLLETPCTLGLPVIWTDLLARNQVPAVGAVLLFLVYLTAFLVDELAVFTAAVVTMRAVKLQERHGRELKLVSGVVMLVLAAVMVLRPEAMERVAGGLAVFAVAAAIGTVAILADRHRPGHRRAYPPTRSL